MALPAGTPLSELVDLIDAQWRWLPLSEQASQAPQSDCVITGVTLNDREVMQGDLFAALPGLRTHGAAFVTSALSRGARAILTDPQGFELLTVDPHYDWLRDEGFRGQVPIPVLIHSQPRAVLGELSAVVYGRPSERMRVIGITGTSGKTTTAYLIEAGLIAAQRSCGLISTIHTRINGHVHSPSSLTTPEAPQLQALLALMAQKGVDTVVMEVSSHALALGRVKGIHFHVGVFTNLSRDHLDFHENLTDYFATKAKLFTTDSSVSADHAVICIDDSWGKKMVQWRMKSGGKVKTVATQDIPADWQAIVEQSPSLNYGQKFSIKGPQNYSATEELALPGKYNVSNAALALAALNEVDVPPQKALQGLVTARVPGRLERIERGQDFIAIVDYAHKPTALEAVIAALRAQFHGRLAVVLGAGGERDRGKRSVMGHVAAQGADLLIVTDDNPRSEDPAAIRSAILAGAAQVSGGAQESGGKVRNCANRAQAIAAAVHWAQPHDVVLIAGKGHEQGQEIAGVVYPFDDREVLSAAIDARLSQG